MKDLIAAICREAGYSYRLHHSTPGGDINSCYTIDAGSARLFLKLNDAGRYPGMFKREAEGLVALEGKGLTVPAVLDAGIMSNQQYLLLSHLDKGVPQKNFWQHFAAGLAAIHQSSEGYFGWRNDNYIGSLVQTNNPHGDWASFYANQRILPLVKRLIEGEAFEKTLSVPAENLCKKLQDIFPSEPAALLHGDLWSGNFMAGHNGYATIYDPAVYYGHREMDLGMTKLFGGFDREFYQAYEEIFPLEKGWSQRVSLTQLYPLLVHAVLFGGGYIQSCRQIIKTWS